jgi:hypothetical protein
MLRLVPPASSSSGDLDDCFVDQPYRLVSRPQRPGELTVTVTVRLEAAARQHVVTAVIADRIPAPLWLAVAIEAARCVRLVGTVMGRSADEVAAALDAAVDASRPPAGSAHPSLSLLRRYARALLVGDGSYRPIISPTLLLSPATHVGAAWAIEAERVGLSIEEWASGVAADLPVGRIAWEAASAAEGQPLAEWALFQAARRWRAASTSARSRARS